MGSQPQEKLADKLVSRIDTIVGFGHKCVTTFLSWGKPITDYRDGLLTLIFSAVAYSVFIIAAATVIASCLGVPLLSGALITLGVLVLLVLLLCLMGALTHILVDNS